MPQLTIQNALQLASQHHQAGRLQEAESIYRQILTHEPRNADAIQRLGMIAQQVGRPDTAVDLIRQAIAIKPDYAEAHCNLAIALTETGQIDQAVAACRQAIALRPNFPEAFYNLGNALNKNHQPDAAVAAYRQALRLRPEYPEVLGNLGIILQDKGEIEEAIAAHRQAVRLKPNYAVAYNNFGSALKEATQLDGSLDEAIEAFQHAIRLNPNLPEPHNNLGMALKDKGLFDEAMAAFRHAITLRPNYAGAYTNLGIALQDVGQLDQAEAAHRQALRFEPDYAAAFGNLGNVLKIHGRLDEAIAAYRQALALKPNLPIAHNNLGNALKDVGLLDEAIAAYRNAVAINPNYTDGHNNLIYALHFHPDLDAQAIAEEIRIWNRRQVQPLKEFLQPHANDPDPDRRLRIGYVSPDFRQHVVGQNLQPLFQHHNHEQFEITCYAQVPRPDDITRQFQKNSDRWRNINGLSDHQVAEQIRRDQIDILIDLTLQMAGSRLLVFARKPAPIQVTYLGYCTTTGLQTMDYRLSDPYLDPLGSDDSWATERTLRLPKTYWCYQPGGEAPDPAPPVTDASITFGCQNNFCKVSEKSLELWQKILDAVPNSRLVLSTPEGRHRRALVQRFGDHRLQLLAQRPWLDYMRAYQSIDIALDPFPYNGGITTCEALWMGAPVVTLSGNKPMGRAGRSILNVIGLPELVADSPDDYIKIAAQLAADPARRAQFRATLRDRMRNSPLMNAPEFTKDVESAYRAMWRTWCAGLSHT